jgi:hypothetical protein
MIILTNSRTLLRSDWIDAPDAVRYAIYALIYVLWAAALTYSIRAYRAERDLEAETVQLSPSADAGAEAGAGVRAHERTPQRVSADAGA